MESEILVDTGGGEKENAEMNDTQILLEQDMYDCRLITVDIEYGRGCKPVAQHNPWHKSAENQS